MSIVAEPDYQLFCAERLQNPYPLFDRLRSQEPVHWCEPINMWLVTRYEDVHAGLRHPLLSSDRTSMYVQALPPSTGERVQPLLNHISKWIQLTDDPDHKRLRKLVNLAFVPRTINSLRSRIEALVNEFLDEVPRGQSFDLIKEVAGPLPATVICEMLGIPLRERDAFRLATEKVMQFSTRGGPSLSAYADEAAAALDELVSMFARLVEERRSCPKDDLLSALVSAEADGDRLSNEELYAMCVFIFLAGHETTTNGIANGILALLENPDQWDALKAAPDALVGGLVEETLRYESPVPRAVRKATADFAMGDKVIASGQLVVLLLGAANRDPQQFLFPDKFCIDRPDNRHLAFGYGSHFCIGAALARMEMETAFRTIANRFPNLQLTGEDLEWKPTMGVRALEALPVAWM